MAKKSLIETKKEQALKIVEELISMKYSSKEVVQNIQKVAEGINKEDEKYKRLNSALNSINITTQAALKEFKKDQQRISKLLLEADQFYVKKYVPLRDKIKDKQTGFEANIKNAKKELSEFNLIKRSCRNKYNEIVVLGNKFHNKTKELQKIEEIINSLHKNINKDKLSIDNLLAASLKASSQIDELRRNIISINTASKTLYGEISKLKTDSDSLNKQIHTIFNSSNEKLDEIKKIYSIASEVGLSGEFEVRRNNLKDEIKKWECYILIASVLLFIGIFIFFLWQYCANGNKFDEVFNINFYVRFLIFSPIIYYLYFISTQHYKAKKLHDKYAFKTTLAMTIKAHIELLTQHDYFPNKNDEIVDFILDGFRIIYSEPYIEDGYKAKIKVANIEIELQKQMIKKLKEVLSESNNSILTNIET